MGARRTKPDTDQTAPLGATRRAVPSASDLRLASETASQNRLKRRLDAIIRETAEVPAKAAPDESANIAANPKIRPAGPAERTAGRVAARLRAIAAMPIALHAHERANGTPILRDLAPHVHSRLRPGADRTIEIETDHAVPITIKIESERCGRCSFRYADGDLNYDTLDLQTTMAVEDDPDLALDLDTLAILLSDDRDGTDARAAAALIADAAADLAEGAIRRLTDPATRRSDEGTVDRALHAMTVCAAMAEGLDPERILEISTSASGDMTALVYDEDRRSISSMRLPVPEHLSALLPKCEIQIADVSSHQVLDGKKPLLQIEIWPAKIDQVDIHRIAEDPIATMQAVREYGDDGAELRAALQAGSRLA